MRIHKGECSGLIIDIQEKLFLHMDQPDVLLRRSLILIEGLQLLGVPLLITEQYPRGLGNTHNDVKQAMASFKPVEKLSFSCCDEPAFMEALSRLGKKVVVICGIEAHVCVLQTVIDLVGSGFRPVVVADCTSSRNPTDKQWALQRMLEEGAIITTCESILFEIARVAGNEQFKAISRLVK